MRKKCENDAMKFYGNDIISRNMNAAIKICYDRRGNILWSLENCCLCFFRWVSNNKRINLAYLNAVLSGKQQHDFRNLSKKISKRTKSYRIPWWTFYGTLVGTNCTKRNIGMRQEEMQRQNFFIFCNFDMFKALFKNFICTHFSLRRND